MGTVALENDMVFDFIDTAFAGGSNYWIRTVKTENKCGAKYLSGVPSAGGTLIVVDDEYGKAYELTAPKMKQGIEKAAAYFGKTIDAFYENHDGSDADVALQFALFGEIIFG